jgi:hypothetical protein
LPRDAVARSNTRSADTATVCSAAQEPTTKAVSSRAADACNACIGILGRGDPDDRTADAFDACAVVAALEVAA